MSKFEFLYFYYCRYCKLMPDYVDSKFIYFKLATERLALCINRYFQKTVWKEVGEKADSFRECVCAVHVAVLILRQLAE